MTGASARARKPAGPRVLLAVTGGIAAYKALELVRLMRRADWNVVVAMTRAACRFVGPESFRALSGNQVALELFPKRRLTLNGARSTPSRPASGVEHVDLAASADLVVVAPATANVLGKLASGVADDLVSTLLLAVPAATLGSGRVLLAPAMNVNMWRHPSVQANVGRLRGFGYRFVEPGTGELACGALGTGRMAEPQEVFRRCRAAFTGRAALAGLRALVTTGRTEEEIDPVRVITNRSSGLMGAEVAAGLFAAGAAVKLIAGPVSTVLPVGLPVTPVRSTEEMLEAVMAELPQTDVLVMCAAVADFRPARALPRKRSDRNLTVELVRTPDILTAVSATEHHARVVGFSLDDSIARARLKLRRKRLDIVVANPLATPGSMYIRPTLLFRGGRTLVLPEMTKPDFARRLVAEIDRLVRRNRTAGREAGRR